jgi:hypothetical protein
MSGFGQFATMLGAHMTVSKMAPPFGVWVILFTTLYFSFDILSFSGLLTLATLGITHGLDFQ